MHLRVGFLLFFFHRKFHWGENFPGGELVGGNYTLGKFPKISI